MAKHYSRLKALIELMDLEFMTSYRFPMLEILIIIYVPLALVIPSIGFSSSELESIFNTLTTSSSLVNLITMILIIKTVAYDIGASIERGYLTNILSMPLKRADVFLTKFIISGLVMIILWVYSQITALMIKIPSIAFKYPLETTLALLANLSPLIEFLMFTLAFTLIVKRGGVALGIAIALWFGLSIIGGILSFLVLTTKSKILLIISGIISSPALLLRAHYLGSMIPSPIIQNTIRIEFHEALLGLIGNYLVSLIIFILTLYYFMRRFEPI